MTIVACFIRFMCYHYVANQNIEIKAKKKKENTIDWRILRINRANNMNNFSNIFTKLNCPNENTIVY